MANVTYTAIEDDMVDMICRVWYGKESYTPMVLAANPGLADYERLPAGHVVILPEIAPEQVVTAAPPRLYD